MVNLMFNGYWRVSVDPCGFVKIVSVWAVEHEMKPTKHHHLRLRDIPYFKGPTKVSTAAASSIVLLFTGSTPQLVCYRHISEANYSQPDVPKRLVRHYLGSGMKFLP